MDNESELPRTEVARIDSNNFVDYLLGFETDVYDRRLVGRKCDFEKEIYPGKDVMEIIDSIAQVTKGEPFVEQGSVIYMLKNTGEIKGTNPVSGSELSVDLGPAYDEVFKQKGFPMIAVHNHLNQYMFTPMDYLPLVCGNKQDLFRWSRAVIVLLPDDTQVMAVATDETPIFNNPIEAENHLAKRNEEMKKSVRAIDTGLVDSEGKIMNEVPRMINSEQVNFAYEMGVKLYRRVGKGNFREFSA